MIRTMTATCLALAAMLAAAWADDTKAEIGAVFAGVGFTHHQEALDWAASGVHEGPFHMVNLLKFRDEALYESDVFPPATGREAQARYGQAMREVVTAFGIEPLYVGRVEAVALSLGVEPDHWDMITVIRYPDAQTLLRLVEDPRYRAAIVHKYAALERTAAIITIPPR